MPDKFVKAPDYVFEMVTEVQQLWHPDLEDARIDILFCAVAPRSKGRAMYGSARMVPEQWSIYADFDFVLTFAKEAWAFLTDEQLRALADHVLSHCKYINGTYTLVDHDVTDFTDVLARHGFWWNGAEKLRDAMKPHFAFVDDLEPAEAPVNNEDVLDQIGDMLVARSKHVNGNGAGIHAVEESAEEQEV